MVETRTGSRSVNTFSLSHLISLAIFKNSRSRWARCGRLWVKNTSTHPPGVMTRSQVASSARCFFFRPERYVRTYAPTYTCICICIHYKEMTKCLMVMMVAHLGMIKDKVREEDQTKACTQTHVRVCV